MSVEFDRVKLYEEVWITPLTKLGEKYGLSDNGLRKICKAMQIPLPTVGHWAKVAAGHTVQRPPLPGHAERTTFASYPRDPQETRFERPEDQAWLGERLAFETSGENAIAFDPQPRRWHAAVAPLRGDLRKTLEAIEADRKEAERLERFPRKSEPTFAGWTWRSFESSGQVISPTRNAYPLRVTPLTYERALAILNTLCYSSESRGFKATLASVLLYGYLPGRMVADPNLESGLWKCLSIRWQTSRA